ncbi:MFS transporter [Amycolatopsis sp. NPDC049868]|uniref:MFS transporter n=1 Tax=Amycolatopsis sp. NPDC049868 TaxID=3363934 RepID=UPI00379F2644
MIGFFVMVLEGYDLIAFGATVPLLLRYEPWGLTLPALGILGSLAPIGMLCGALLAGPLSDRYGRRRTTLLSLVVVSVAMLASAAAPGPFLFGVSRVVVGLGVGAIFPAMVPLVFEFASPKRKNFNSAIILCGITVGGSFAALVAANFLVTQGFRTEYLIGGMVGLLLVPITLRWLPESPEFQRTDGATSRIRPVTRGVGLVLRRPYLARTVLFCGTVTCSYLLIFGMNTWLPQLMLAARYPLGSSLTFLMLLNLGATVGTLLMALLADRAGSKGPVVACFVLGAVAIVALSVRSAPVVLYAIIVLGGCGVIGGQALITVYISRTYPSRARASAVGVALGVGRIGAIVGPALGGWILAAGLPPQWNFVLFAVPAVLGAILTLVIRTRSEETKGNPFTAIPLNGRDLASLVGEANWRPTLVGTRPHAVPARRGRGRKRR